MQNPFNVPLIGSGFDAIANQRYQWGQANRATEESNLARKAAAEQNANNYFARLADMERSNQALAIQDRRYDDSIARDAALMNRRDYEFGVGRADTAAANAVRASEFAKELALRTRGLDIQEAKENPVVEKRLREDYGNAITKAANGDFDSAGQISTMFPNLKPDHIVQIWDENRRARKEAEFNFNQLQNPIDTLNDNAMTNWYKTKSQEAADTSPSKFGGWFRGHPERDYARGRVKEWQSRLDELAPAVANIRGNVPLMKELTPNARGGYDNPFARPEWMQRPVIDVPATVVPDMGTGGQYNFGTPAATAAPPVPFPMTSNAPAVIAPSPSVPTNSLPAPLAGPPVISSQVQYDALQPGEPYQDESGNIRQKKSLRVTAPVAPTLPASLGANYFSNPVTNMPAVVPPAELLAPVSPQITNRMIVPPIQSAPMTIKTNPVPITTPAVANTIAAFAAQIRSDFQERRITETEALARMSNLENGILKAFKTKKMKEDVAVGHLVSLGSKRSEAIAFLNDEE